MLADKPNLHKNIAYYLTLSLAFLLPFKLPVPDIIALLTLNWLIEGDFKNKFSKKAQQKYLLLFIAFYFIHLVALLYTTNISEGLTALEVKLSILIFPLLFCTTAFSAQQVQFFLKAFIYGCLSAMLFCLLRAVYFYFTEGVNYFFYMDLSYFMHPGYFSMYLSVAAFILLFTLLNKNNSIIPSVTKVKYILILVFITVFILMLSAKLGIIAYFFLAILILLIEFISRKKYLWLLGSLFISIGSLTATYQFVPSVHDRFSNLFSVGSNKELDKTSSESTTVRILIWDAAQHIIKENFWLGVSPGDTNDKLYEEYKKRGYTGAYEHKLNAHNQYYQTFIGLGIVGFLLLLAQLLFPFLFAVKNKKYSLLFFILLISFNFFTESILQTQSGVIFYAFFNSLFLFYDWKGLLISD